MPQVVIVTRLQCRRDWLPPENQRLEILRKLIVLKRFQAIWCDASTKNYIRVRSNAMQVDFRDTVFLKWRDAIDMIELAEKIGVSESPRSQKPSRGR